MSEYPNMGNLNGDLNLFGPAKIKDVRTSACKISLYGFAVFEFISKDAQIRFYYEAISVMAFAT